MLQQLNMSWYLELFFQVLLPSITTCSNVAQSQPAASNEVFFFSCDMEMNATDTCICLFIPVFALQCMPSTILI